jgi:hypothetical protein
MRKTYDYLCRDCSRRTIHLVEDEERNNPQPCPCGALAPRTFSVPNIRTAKTSASYIDGQRAQSKEWKNTLRQQELTDAVNESDDFADKISNTIELNKFIETTK